MAGGGGVRDHHHYQPQPHHQQQPPQRNLIESPEAYEALDLVLSQVFAIRAPQSHGLALFIVLLVHNAHYELSFLSPK